MSERENSGESFVQISTLEGRGADEICMVRKSLPPVGFDTVGLTCLAFVESESGGTGEGGEPPSNKRDEGMCVFCHVRHLLLIWTKFGQKKFRGRFDVLYPCHFVDNEPCGHSSPVKTPYAEVSWDMLRYADSPESAGTRALHLPSDLPFAKRAENQTRRA